MPGPCFKYLLFNIFHCLLQLLYTGQEGYHKLLTNVKFVYVSENAVSKTHWTLLAIVKAIYLLIYLLFTLGKPLSETLFFRGAKL